MFTRKGKLFDPARSTCIVDGVDYTGIVLKFPAICEQEQIIEIAPDPKPEGYVEDEYWMTEDWQTETGPYHIYTRRPQEMIDATRLAQATANRSAAYKNESDPIFFKEQRGEVPAGTWLALVAEIKARYPK